MSGTVIYRASEFGSCDRALVAGRLGYDRKSPPEATQKRMDEGNLHERDVMERLEGEGWTLCVPSDRPRSDKPERVHFEMYDFVIDETNQVVVWTPISSLVLVKGHTDNIGLPPDDWPHRELHNIEVKSMSKDEFAKWKEKRLDQPSNFLITRYWWQISAYGHATGFPTLLIVKDRNSGEIDRMTIELPALPYSRLDIVRRGMYLEGLVARGELPECTVAQFPCPFYYLNCTSQAKPSERVINHRLDEACRLFNEASAEAKKWDDLKKERRAQLDVLLGGTEKVKAGGFATGTDEWEVREGTSTWDQWNATKAKEDGVDLEKYREKRTTHYPRVVKRKKEKE